MQASTSSPNGQYGVSGSSQSVVARCKAWWGAKASEAQPIPTDRIAAVIGDRLGEASRIWTAHLGTAQNQMREATENLLAGFTSILEELNHITDTGASKLPGASSALELDARAGMLSHCESQLHGLLKNFQAFIHSRDQVLGSVKTLSASSGSLSEMADDVAKLARQTSLLSINAAIEAARAGNSGRGFAVVAGEVRRLSNESGDTGRRISSQVQEFSGCMQRALVQASEYSLRDAQTIKASEDTINEVVTQVDTTVSALNARAVELSARGEVIKSQVEQLMISFQFQDRVHQIMTQVSDSMASAVAGLQQALANGTVPVQSEWQALLNAGYTTDEQRAVANGGSTETARTSGGETTFF